MERFKRINSGGNWVVWLVAIVFTTFTLPPVYAQITITSPVNNQVVQRSLTDSATISVTGYAYRPYQDLNVKLVSESGAAEQSVDFPSAQRMSGFFQTQVKTGKGWYRILVTGTKTDGRQDTVSVKRVGVGEVFLICGNSNAMGLPRLGAIGGSENVISIDTVNKHLNTENITVAIDEPMRSPVFTQFKSASYSFPTGETSWLWAELGDMIYKRFGTPVLFLNAGWAAASSINYQEAASGKDTYNTYVGKNWPYKQPYTNIVNTLQYFHSWLGIRSVIWSHGENDAHYLKIDQASYYNNIQYVIQRSREDFGYNVPWVIGLSTAGGIESKPYAPVILAQKALAGLKGFNTWLGADTDTIQIPRPSHGHFENIQGGTQGLSLAAKAWNRSLPDTFFRSVVPIQPGAAIHTGAVPAQTFPGASFPLPFVTTGTTPNSLMIQAELLTESGMFVALVGTGKSTPLAIQLPRVLPDGHYRIRLTGVKPTLVGSVSETIQVHRKYVKTGFFRHLAAEKRNNLVEVSWMMTANPGVRQIVLQRSADHRYYTDIKSFIAPDNALNSGVYSFTDTDMEKGSIYYRIRMEYADGKSEVSAALVVFGDNAPPGFTVFPNPVEGQYFFLRPNTADVDCKLYLYDMRGKQHPVETDDTQVVGVIMAKPVYAVPAGMYILKIVSGDAITTQKVLFR